MQAPALLANGDIDPNLPQMSRPLVVQLSANKLSGKDLFSKPDCRLVMFKKPSGGKWQYIGCTELVWNEKNVDYKHQIMFDYRMEEPAKYRIGVFDIECVFVENGHGAPSLPENYWVSEGINGRHYTMYFPRGHINISVEELLGMTAEGNKKTYKVVDKKDKPYKDTTIDVKLHHFPASARVAHLQFKIKDFKRSSLWALIDKDDLSYEIITRPGKGREVVAYCSEIDWNTQNPKFKAHSVPLALFDADPTSQFFIRIWRQKSNSSAEIMAESKPMCLAEMQYTKATHGKKKPKFDCFNEKGKDVCDMYVKNCVIGLDPQFPHGRSVPFEYQQAHFPVFKKHWKKD